MDVRVSLNSSCRHGGNPLKSPPFFTGMGIFQVMFIGFDYGTFKSKAQQA
jgi:hypothetical chaperone protein